MKNIHNLVSDAFVAADLHEEDYVTVIRRDSTRRLYISITSRSDPNIRIMMDILHDLDGYIRTVRLVENTLLVQSNASYIAFVNTIYDEEFVYM
jgi:hypothetical protein